VRAPGAGLNRAMLVPDRSGEPHDPLEVADELDHLGDRSQADKGEALHDAADVMRGLYVRALLASADSPWPLPDVLKKLADAADHLLNDHACDAHGHEGLMQARDAARSILEKIAKANAR